MRCGVAHVDLKDVAFLLSDIFYTTFRKRCGVTHVDLKDVAFLPSAAISYTTFLRRCGVAHRYTCGLNGCDLTFSRYFYTTFLECCGGPLHVLGLWSVVRKGVMYFGYFCSINSSLCVLVEFDGCHKIVAKLK